MISRNIAQKHMSTASTDRMFENSATDTSIAVMATNIAADERAIKSCRKNNGGPPKQYSTTGQAGNNRRVFDRLQRFLCVTVVVNKTKNRSGVRSPRFDQSNTHKNNKRAHNIMLSMYWRRRTAELGGGAVEKYNDGETITRRTIKTILSRTSISDRKSRGSGIAEKQTVRHDLRTRTHEQHTSGVEPTTTYCTDGAHVDDSNAALQCTTRRTTTTAFHNIAGASVRFGRRATSELWWLPISVHNTHVVKAT